MKLNAGTNWPVFEQPNAVALVMDSLPFSGSGRGWLPPEGSALGMLTCLVGNGLILSWNPLGQV